jgi:antitoxin component YwqK of YwqJK toxin-antitoxin module
MLTLTKYVCFLLLLSGVAGCGMKLEPVISETYPDGAPKVVHYFSGEGMEKTLAKKSFYYPDGQLRMEGEYKNGQKNGLWVAYYESGLKWSEGNYKDGVSHGKTITYHENGKKYYEGFYDEGRRVGLWRFWNEEGVLEKEINYEDE